MIKSVQKAFRILAVLSDRKGKPVRLAVIAQKLGENKSTCSHILKTLEHDGYVEQVSHTQGYILGPASYCLTRYGKYDDDFVSLCRPILRYVYKHTNEVVTLAIIQKQTKFIIDYIDTEKRIFSEDAAIRTDDIYRTATGRIILANMDKRMVSQIYEKHGNPLEEDWPEIDSLQALQAELGKINRRGVLRTIDYRNNACYIGYAAPIYKKGKCIASMGVAIRCSVGEEEAYLADRDEEIQTILMKGANEITRRLKYSE